MTLEHTKVQSGDNGSSDSNPDIDNEQSLWEHIDALHDRLDVMENGYRNLAKVCRSTHALAQTTSLDIQDIKKLLRQLTIG